MTPAPTSLVFVYNADEGWAAALLDAAHKLISPATYACSLCAITHGAVTMRSEWRDWIEDRDISAQFYHRQDFARAFPAFADQSLPAIFQADGTDLRVLLDDTEIAGCKDVAGLIAAIEAEISPR